MISIIIPAHNERDNLKKLLGYLTDLSQTDNVEIIVSLSEATHDGTENIPVEGSVRFLRCDANSRPIQMNRGADLAQGDILVFLHADVLPPKTFLRDIAAAVAQGHRAGCFSYRFDSDKWLLKLNSYFTGLDTMFTGGGDQCLFIEKPLFHQLNGFDEHQVLMEDFEFFRRMKRNKVPYTIVQNDILVSARKYDYNSYARINLSNLLLVILFKFGLSSEKLRAVHDKLIRMPYRE